MKIHPAVFVLVLCVPGAVQTQSRVQAVHDESSVTYHLTHPLHKIEATSRDVLFDAMADMTARKLTGVTANVDVMTFDSGNSNRDSHAMEVIDALSFPDVRFTSTAIVQTGDSAYVTGDLTFHGVTKPVVAALLLQWSNGGLRAVGRMDVSLQAFAIERPSLLMIPVEDDLRFDIVAVFKTP